MARLDDEFRAEIVRSLRVHNDTLRSAAAQVNLHRQELARLEGRLERLESQMDEVRGVVAGALSSRSSDSVGRTRRVSGWFFAKGDK